MTDRIPPTSDLGFRKIMTSPETKDVLQGIIGDFFNLRIPLDEITVTAPYDIKAYREYIKQADGSEKSLAKFRETIQDVTADIKSAGFGAEIQIKNEQYYSIRSVYYACSRFCANYNRTGEMKQLPDGTYLRYSSLKPIYSLNILGYAHFSGDDDALRILTLYDSERKKSLDREYLTIAYFELTKGNVETANLRHWQTYFNTGESADNAPDYIKKATRVIEKANLTQEERDMFEQFERAEERYKNTIYAALLEGEERGMKLGEERGEERVKKLWEADKKETTVAIARNALQMGMTINEVSRLTGKSEDEIRQLMH